MAKTTGLSKTFLITSSSLALQNVYIQLCTLPLRLELGCGALIGDSARMSSFIFSVICFLRRNRNHVTQNTVSLRQAWAPYSVSGLKSTAGLLWRLELFYACSLGIIGCPDFVNPLIRRREP